MNAPNLSLNADVPHARLRARSGPPVTLSVRPRMITSKRLQLALAALIGLVAARAYFHWLVVSGTHKAALHSFGVPAYWSLLALPALVLFVPFCVIAFRRRTIATGWIVGGAALGAVLVAYLGLFGDFLFCAFVTRGVCE